MIRKTLLFGLFIEWVLLCGLATALTPKETYKAPSSEKQIYILEDIHGDAAVQKQHLQLLVKLSKREALNLIVSEGAWGYVEAAPIQYSFQNRSNRIASVETLLKQQQINAAHILSGLSNGYYTIVGIEDKKSYQAHQQVKYEIQKETQKVELECKQILKQIEAKVSLDKDFKELIALFHLQASPKLVRKWIDGKFEQTMAHFQNQSIEFNAPLLNQQFSRVRLFYDLAFKRDSIMALNTIERMSLEQQTRSALIVGGFHTEGITQILRDLEISYTVYSPTYLD